MEFYGTSEFWYTKRDILRLGGEYKARNFEAAASNLCQTAWRVLMDRIIKKHLPKPQPWKGEQGQACHNPHQSSLNVSKSKYTRV